ncbi:MAG: hypothetical protein JWP51_3712, partial [Bradyrhizobium sp.]|nr:hypothetical protein [Bradyrhizobium sp.]
MLRYSTLCGEYPGMTDCAELNGDCANIADEANYNSMLNS